MFFDAWISAPTVHVINVMQSEVRTILWNSPPFFLIMKTFCSRVSINLEIEIASDHYREIVGDQ